MLWVWLVRVMALLFGMYDDDPVGWRLGGGDGGDVECGCGLGLKGAHKR